MLRNYFSLSNNAFIYIECDYSIVFSNLGVIIMRSNGFSSIYMQEHTLFTMDVNHTLSSLLSELFLLIYLGYYNKFKIIGVGYRQFYDNNIVVYKLRYSHLIYNVLDLSLLVTKKLKKKKYFTVYSLDKSRLNRLINVWLNYRVPNVYTKKGFIKRGSTVRFKKVTKKIM